MKGGKSKFGASAGASYVRIPTLGYSVRGYPLPAVFATNPLMHVSIPCFSVWSTLESVSVTGVPNP